MIVDNAGEGPEPEDVLFAWPITGHCRYAPGSTREGRAAGRGRRTPD